jgi:uncharacterized membrane protein YsdA (DUF1294 family)
MINIYRKYEEESEKTLLSLTALEEQLEPGAMLFFRHKTAKTSFLWKFWNTTSNCDYLSSLQ